MSRTFPHNYEAEQILLGSLIFADQLWHQIAGMVGPGDFMDPLHGRIFEAIGMMVDRNQTVSVVALANVFEHDEALKDIGARGYLNMMRLERSLPPALPQMVEDQARLVRDLADRRRIIQLAEEAIEAAERPEIDRTAADIAANLSTEISASVGSRADTVRSIGDLAIAAVEGLKVELPCYPTGLPRLDKALGGGLYPGRFYGVGARYKVGKSLLLATIAANLNKAGVRTLYLSLEMGPDEITQRILAREAGVNSMAFLDKKWRSHPDFQRDAAEAAVRLKRERDNLLFDTRPRMAWDDVRGVISRVALTRGIKGVIVDYIQLVTGQQKGQSQAAHLDHVAQGMAEVGKQLGIFVLTAAQLNQDENIRGGEGLLNGCDVALKLHKIDAVTRAEPDRGWLEMTAARYVRKANIGSADDPAYRYVTASGPYLEEFLLVGNSPEEEFVA